MTVLVLASMNAVAQSAGSLAGSSPAAGTTVSVNTPYQAVESGPNHTLWQRITYDKGPNGQVMPQVHKYTELATGLNHLANGQWVTSKEEIDILPDGTAAATNGQHQVFFPADIYQGVITLKTPDAVMLQSRPLGLCYDDGTSTVMIAELTNSIGELTGANQVIYSHAFSGLTADMRYTYTRAGFEQDVILRQRPPDPKSLGLNASTTRLELLTEFFNPPSPGVAGQTLPAQAGLALDDEMLDFGIMKMVPGQAFLLGQNTIKTRVAKQWLNVQGRTLLVEEIPVMAVADQLATLPLTASANGGAGHFQYLASKRLQLPAQRLMASIGRGRLIRLAKSPGPANGLVMDYQTVSSSVSGFTFQGDSTYYISGFVELFGTNTFEGGAVIKYTNNATLAVFSTNIIWLANSYRPVVFTAKDDNTVGDIISGSTGSPSGYYASTAIEVATSQLNISNFRIAYANYAIGWISSGVQATLANGQLVNCNYGILGYTAYLRNILFNNVNTDLSPIGGTFDMQNCTFNTAIYLINTGTGALVFTNCIIANVGVVGAPSGCTMSGAKNGFYNMGLGSPFGASPITISTNPFQIRGAGSNYLASGCSFLNSGTTNIDPVLLTSLRSQTTYPPVIYSNVTFSVATNLSIQATRDTYSNPSLGYHYNPLDYVFENCTANSNVIFNAGIAAAWLAPTYYNYGIFCSSNAQITLNGTATSPDQWVGLDTVQEAAAESSYTGWGISCSQTNFLLNANFTHFSALAGDESPIGFNFGQVNLTNCELYNTFGEVQYDPEDIFLKNCLVFRPDWSGIVVSSSPRTNFFSVQDCTFYQGSLSLYGIIYLSVSNSAFNGTSFTLSVTSTNCDYNAFLQGSNRLPAIGSHDVIVTNSFNWQSSWSGNLYLPPDSPLINHGNTTADQLGMYHFTTQTNQVKETNSIVDIGYHYVATDTFGNPFDSNGDGIPDYLEDANGDGLVNNGEMSWTFGIATQPANQTAYVGNAASFNVTCYGSGPIWYQWLFNGTNIVGATNATLVLNIVQTSNAGTYSVIVSNTPCSITSSNATLTVLNPVYAVLTGSQTNYTFRSDTTYYIPGSVYLYGTNIFEGGAVLKYGVGGSITLATTNNIWLTASYRPILFTAKDDNTVGLAISGSSGFPAGYYANSCINYGLSNTFGFSNFRMSFAYTGISIQTGTNQPTFANAQFVNCYNALAGGGMYLRNNLFSHVVYDLYPFLGGTVDIQNSTFDSGGTLMYSTNIYGGIFAYTNCIFANMANITIPASFTLKADHNGFYNSGGGTNFGTTVISVPAYPFQSMGAGNYYLTNGSSCQNAGTTNIDPNLLSSLGNKTTQPPLIYTNILISTNIILSVQASRDNDTPDLGYHYDPIDYLVDTFTVTNALLTVSNGTVVASLNSGSGIWLQDNSAINATGSPQTPVWFVYYLCSQEQSLALGSGSSTNVDIINNYHNGAIGQSGKYTFCKFASPASAVYDYIWDRQNWAYSNLVIQDCELWNSQVNTYIYSAKPFSSSIYFNNLLNRTVFYANDTTIAGTSGTNSSITMSNNLVLNTFVNISSGSSSNLWSAFNNSFDGCIISNLNVHGQISAVRNGYNAYLNCIGRLFFTNAFDIVLSNSVAYQTGTLGMYYQPTNSPLINAGSTTADQVGLYHFTTQTNQMVEGASIVDIGYHYVATDQYGNPLDSNGDGITDYLEDANGNGLFDPGEIDWRNYYSSMKVFITQPRNGSQ